MFQEAKIVENPNQDRKVRQNQIAEYKKILEEDKVDHLIAEQLATDLEQAAYHLSCGENTREYRTKMNTIKMRLKGTKGQWIRSLLTEKIITPMELMQFDMQKFSEDSVQAFILQNNRMVPQKQSFIKKQQPPNIAIPNLKQEAQIILGQIVDFEEDSATKEVKAQNVVENSINQKGKQNANIENQEASQAIQQQLNETDKLDFTPHEEPIQQFEDIGDYSFEYNQKQSAFIEKNDIEDLQLNHEQQQSNTQENDQIATYQIGSPLPSDNALNLEFIQDENQDEIKQSCQNYILDSQIQQEEQFYYDHQCSFQAKDINFEQQSEKDFVKIDHQDEVLSSFGQQGKQEQKKNGNDPCLHTHNLQECIQQKILEQEQQDEEFDTHHKSKKESQFESIINQRNHNYELQLKQLTQTHIDLQKVLVHIQQEHFEQLSALHQESLNNENRIQVLGIENNLLKQQLVQQEQFVILQMNALKEQNQIERQQYHRILENYQNQRSSERNFIDQIQFNTNLRKEQFQKYQAQNSFNNNFDDQIQMVQEMLNRVSISSITNQYINRQNYQLPNNNQIYQTSQNQQYWANEDDIAIQGTLLNADSGSTQIKRPDQINQLDVVEEQEQQLQDTSSPEEQQIDQNRIFNSIQQVQQQYSAQHNNEQQNKQELEPVEKHQIENNQKLEIAYDPVKPSKDIQMEKNNQEDTNYWEQQFQQVNVPVVRNVQNQQQQQRSKKIDRLNQKHANVPGSLFD